jgi:hypothetical protein
MITIGGNFKVEKRKKWSKKFNLKGQEILMKQMLIKKFLRGAQSGSKCLFCMRV